MLSSSRPLLALAISLGSCASLLGCESSALLAIDLRTDYVPGIEIVGVQIEIVDRAGTSRELTVDQSTSAIDGVRIAEYADLPTGRHMVEVRLLAPGGAQLADHRLLVDLSGSRVATVVITRDCHDVSCESGGPAPEACLGGACVDARCTWLGRRAAGVVYVPTSDDTLIIAGNGHSEEIAGTWALSSGGSAVLRDQLFLPRRNHFAIAYDPVRDLVLVYGGHGASCEYDRASNCPETWRYVRF